MSGIIHHVPGLLAAGFAFVALRVLELLNPQSLALELLVFLVAYLVVAVLAERAMKAYGKAGRQP